MITPFSILVNVLLLLASIENSESADNESCVNGCPYGYGTGQPFEDIACNLVLFAIISSRSACYEFFGDSLSVSDTGYYHYGLVTTNNNVCDYFDNKTTVPDCLYPNGTTEINFCASLVTFTYRIRDSCTSLFTLDTCALPVLAQLSINYGLDPDNNCSPGPYMEDCEFLPSDSARSCPYCEVSSCSSS